jgi:ribonuclease HI
MAKEEANRKLITIYTDGACRGNGKVDSVGGWGATLSRTTSEGVKTKEIFGGNLSTTNNRMELTAVIESLTLLKDGSTILVYSDSKYVIEGITSWIIGWIKKGWKSSTGQPVLNKDLWLKLKAQTDRLNVTFKWVKGHSGDVGNERADFLANLGIDKVLNSTKTTPSNEEPKIDESDAALPEKLVPVAKPTQSVKQVVASVSSINQEDLDKVTTEAILFARGERAEYGWFASRLHKERRTFTRFQLLTALKERLDIELLTLTDD